MSAETSRATLDRAIAGAALALYSLAVAVGFCRVFSQWEFLGDLLVVVLVGHVTGFLLRHVHVAFAIVIQLVVVAWACAVVVYWDTFRFGFPTPTTWELLRSDLSLVGDQFSQAVAPVIYAGGWTTLAVLGIGVVVALSDVFAFRASARFEALVPGGVLFIIVSALGDGRDQVLTTGALILAGILAVSALRAMQHRPARIVIGRQRPQGATLASTALALGALTAVTAGVIGPVLPGAESEAIYDTRNGPPEITRIESPLVDIRPRLVNQSAQEMFSVTAERQSYWRLASLGEFDGTRWKLNRSSLTGADDLGNATEGRTMLRQEIVIAAHRGALVPAAADPLSASGLDLRWSEENATLLVPGEEGVRGGDRITVESALPTFTAEQLDAATISNAPGGGRYTELPSDLDPFIADQARSITAGAPTPYRQALAIQRFFRDNFEYSLDVQQGSGNNAIISFLRQRVGYCEQFAGTFAAMARSVGLPTRVAVGYTAGTRDEATGTFKVAGRNSHAWPEVWFDGLGWVPFEPTPGRGIPGAERYTGVEAQQETGEVVPPGTGGEPGEGPAPTSVAPGSISGPPASLDEVPDIRDPDTDSIPAVATGGRSGGPDLNRIAAPVLIALFLMLGVAIAPSVLRRVRARHLGADPEVAIVSIYERLRSLVTAAGAPTTSSVTPREFARRAAQTVPGVRSDLTRLTDAVTASTFGPAGQIDPQLVASCEGWYASIERVAKTLLPWHVRLWRYVTLQ